MGGLKFLHIKNWEKYQHYKGRHQIWVKLYKDIVNSRLWVSLSDAKKAHLIALLCIANEQGNIDHDTTIVRLRAGLRRPPDLQFFLKVGFLEPIIDLNEMAASKPLANSYTEKRREEKKREEGVDLITPTKLSREQIKKQIQEAMDKFNK